MKIQKLLEFREWIVQESKKPENRYFRKDGRKGRLNKKFRYVILEKLLILQQEVNLKLITDYEVKITLAILESRNYEEY